MIKSIRLRNFRGFVDVHLPLKPLTVLLGPSSSGKSSFGHALSAMAHAQWKYGKGSNASLTPEGSDAQNWPVDLGGYADLCTHSLYDRDRVYVSLETHQGWATLGFGMISGDPRLRLSYLAIEDGPSSVGLNTTQLIEPTAGSPEGIPTGVGSITQVVSKFSGIELRRKNEFDWLDTADRINQLGLDGLVLNTVKHALGGTEIATNRGLRSELENLFTHTSYLRAVRKRPERTDMAGTAEPQDIGYSGEWTSTILRETANVPTPFFEPLAVPKTLDEAAQSLDSSWPVNSSLSLQPATNFWLQKLGLAATVHAKTTTRDSARIETRLSLRTESPSRNITEVGFGLSQILPVLVAGLQQPADSLFIVDLPEAHLHPRPQAALADFFCALALAGRHCLVETHSEMLFHRLRLRAALSREIESLIGVYFLAMPRSDGLCNDPEPVGLSFEELVRWPKGFMEEAWELEAQIRLATDARKKAIA